MFGRVLVIALNTYRESVRARILLGLAGVAFFVAFYSIVVGAFTLYNGARVVSDLGAATISLFSIAVSVVIGATSLYRELEQKTVFPILARPIRRGEYLVGKYLGTLLTIAVFIMADAALVLLILATMAGRSATVVSVVAVVAIAGLVLPGLKWPSAFTFGPIPWAATLLLVAALLAGNAPDERRVVLGSSLLTLLEVGIVAAIATLFSSFSTPFLSALLTIGVFLVGRSAESLARLPVKTFGQLVHDLGVLLSKVFPNLHVYVPPRPLLTGEAADARFSTHVALAFAMALAWAVGLLATASFIFKKRDFL
jgi:ABC-type transport system involved in multi-copper enzyme maturation permease subunit